MFKPLSYTSSIIWHFVRGVGDNYPEKENDSFNKVVKSILSNKNEGTLLINPPGAKSSHHHRIFSLEKSESFVPSDGGGSPAEINEYELLEPRSIGFADIPINNLPVHIKRYFGIGLGFKRDSLCSRIEDLKPVDYFPRKNFFSLKNASENYEPGESQFNLKGYSKIPTTGESFEMIYNEREWRSLEDVYFTNTDLAMLFFPTKAVMSKGIEDHKILGLISSGVGIICGEDLYDQEEVLK